jgi:hypothetical protein
MSNSNNGDLRPVYEKNSTRAERFAVLILIGLAVEIASAFILEKSLLESSLTIASTTLILVGVWGEIFFERRAKEAGDGIVAEANARAANAEWETERLKIQFAGRRILPDQNRQIAESIRNKSAIFNVLIEFQAGDPEAYTYGIDLVNVFRDSGVEQVRFCGNSYISGMVFGLWLSTAPEIDGSLIALAFTSSGVPIKVADRDLSTHLPRNETAPNLYIFVAPKLSVPVVVHETKATALDDTKSN